MSFYLFAATLPVYLRNSRGYSLQAVGFVVGIAFVCQLVSTLGVGPLVDRRGARVAIRAGTLLYLLAALLFLVTSNPILIGIARAFQGIAVGMVLPATYAIVPDLVSARNRGTALGAIGVLSNVALAIGPPLGLYLLRLRPTYVFAGAALVALVACLLSLFIRVGVPLAEPGRLFTYRRQWTPLLMIIFLTVVYWGVVTAYLPVHVPRAQLANAGWFFSADALSVLAFRIPAGYLTDRAGPRWLLLAGILITTAALGLLLMPPSFLTLVLAGCGTGAGAAFLIPPVLVELTNRSRQTDRGTAMALFSTFFAAAVGVGSLGAAPIVQNLGFQTALVISAVLCVAAIPLAIAIRSHPRFDE